MRPLTGAGGMRAQYTGAAIVTGEAKPREGVGHLFPDVSGVAAGCVSAPPLPTPPWARRGSDLLASSARVRSRSGRESSQSRTVSLSSPLYGEWGVSRDTGHLPWGPGRGEGPLTCRPAAPLTWPRCRAGRWPSGPCCPRRCPGRTACVGRGRGQLPACSQVPTLRPHLGGSCFLQAAVLPGKRGPRDQNLSMRGHLANPPRGGRGGLPQNSWPGCFKRSTARKTEKGRELLQVKETKEMGHWHAECHPGLDPAPGEKQQQWEGTLGTQIGDRIVALVVFTCPDFRNCTAAVEENTVARGRCLKGLRGKG